MDRSAERLAIQLLEEADVRFVDALRDAGLLADLDADELLRVATELEDETGDEEARQVDLLEIYFAAGGDSAASATRVAADRYFIQRVGEPATAASLVARLAALAPELNDVALERFGGPEGPLVVRSGDDYSGVLDDFEEEADSEELKMDHAPHRDATVPMVTVAGSSTPSTCCSTARACGSGSSRSTATRTAKSTSGSGSRRPSS